MSDGEKLMCRFIGALVLASVGLVLGYLLTHRLEGSPLWYLPFGLITGAATGAGFFLLWLNRIERYRD